MGHRVASVLSHHPEFVRFPACTQTSSDLRAHPHPTAPAVWVLGQPSLSLTSRARPGLLAKGKLGSEAPSALPLCLLCPGMMDKQMTDHKARESEIGSIQAEPSLGLDLHPSHLQPGLPASISCSFLS
ncbi:hypothetical protein mRhiFer1_009245 [Rhinolophus ferrumequinum]|uniref:Uncharacterized protein n=1 Tax=Rhinolophus ferrumequinum TaxID=59479 RepID=A0A7J7S7S4_RHIFE|nr:hypothetical protein mRhiFer1_009245 [Rhinolophus ferrumequinum]